jgi:DNA-binding CsgD family transcriptional regulator
VLILDEPGRCCLANRLAAEVLKEGDGLSLTPQGLSAAHRADAVTLREGLNGAAHKEPGQSGPHVVVVRLARPKRRGLRVLVLPRAAPGGPVEGSAPALQAVLIADPERWPEPPVQLLSRQFGLTQAEARLAGHLMQGLSLRQAAAACAVSVNTVRMHLGHLFDKTGTRRQSELVAHLYRETLPLSLAAAVPLGPASAC